MTRIRLLTLTCLLLAAMTAAAAPVRVTVSILPQKWLVEQVGGDQVEVMVLVGPGHSPATYEPTASQMARLLDSEVFFSAGVPFENGLLPRIEGQKNGPVIRGPRHAAGVNHTDLDPHTWLGIDGASAMIDTIQTALTDLRPPSRGDANPWISRGSQALEEIGDAHLEAAQLLEGCRGREFFVFHPAFGHFAAAYGLTQVAVEDHGHEPGPRHLAEMIDRAKAAGARAIIVQPQFSKNSAEAVAEAIDARMVELDPLAYDIPASIRHIARTLADMLECGEGRHE